MVKDIHKELPFAAKHPRCPDVSSSTISTESTSSISTRGKRETSVYALLDDKSRVRYTPLTRDDGFIHVDTLEDIVSYFINRLID